MWSSSSCCCADAPMRRCVWRARLEAPNRQRRNHARRRHHKHLLVLLCGQHGTALLLNVTVVTPPPQGTVPLQPAEVAASLRRRTRLPVQDYESAVRESAQGCLVQQLSPVCPEPSQVQNLVDSAGGPGLGSWKCGGPRRDEGREVVPATSSARPMAHGQGRRPGRWPRRGRKVPCNIAAS